MGDMDDFQLDSWDFDEFDDYSVRTTACNKCDTHGLHWEPIDPEERVWKLHDKDGNAHHCDLIQAEDGFERIPDEKG